jgi:AraC-like DNA-binding protein
VTVSEPGYTIPVRRAQVLVHFAAARGWDAEQLVRSAGLSYALVVEGRSRVTGEQFGLLVRELVRLTDDELLGLGPAPVPPATFRMLGYALLCGSPNLGQVLVRLEDFHRATPGIPPISLRVDGDEATLDIDISDIAHPVDLIVDIFLAATHRMLSWAIRQRLPLRRVGVPYPRPVAVDDYDALFGAPVVFGTASPQLFFDATLLMAPIMRTPDEYDDFVRTAPAELVARRDYGVSMSDRVRRVLQCDDAACRPTADDIAGRLGMSAQTLRRRLHDEGTALSRIREEILRDAAITSLAYGEETVAALSARLGFSEPSAFIRAFRRWTGQPPGAYRLTSSMDVETASASVNGSGR